MPFARVLLMLVMMLVALVIFASHRNFFFLLAISMPLLWFALTLAGFTLQHSYIMPHQF